MNGQPVRSGYHDDKLNKCMEPLFGNNGAKRGKHVERISGSMITSFTTNEKKGVQLIE